MIPLPIERYRKGTVGRLLDRFDLWRTTKRGAILRVVEKGTFIAFLLSILTIMIYQGYLLYLGSNPIRQFEPDNFEYYSYAELAIQQHTLNPHYPYLVYQPVAVFFEHPGLLQMPVLLHWVIPIIPLIWDFRILQIVAVMAIYAFSLLLVKRLMVHSPLHRQYKYLAYTLILLSFLLMQQTEAVEWRGNPFVLVAQLGILYVLALLFTGWRGYSKKKRVALISSVPLLLAFSWYAWSGWEINLVEIGVLVPLFFVYRFLKQSTRTTILKGVVVVVLGVALALVLIPGWIYSFLSPFLSHFIGSCLNNPLNLSEQSCLSASNGLYTVALDMAFGVAMTLAFSMLIPLFANRKDYYEYFVIGIVAMTFLILPLTLIYVRTIELLAPYLAITFAYGIVNLFGYFGRIGSSNVVRSLVMLGIVLSSFYAFLAFANVTATVLRQDTPAGLINTVHYLNASYQNSTVFTYFGYGDYLEAFGHVKTFMNTIQELDASRITHFDDIFLSTPPYACILLANLSPRPDFVLLSPLLANVSLLANATSTSLVRGPLGIEQCGYYLAYENDSFYLFKAGR